MIHTFTRFIVCWSRPLNSSKRNDKLLHELLTGSKVRKTVKLDSTNDLTCSKRIKCTLVCFLNTDQNSIILVVSFGFWLFFSGEKDLHDSQGSLLCAFTKNIDGNNVGKNTPPPPKVNLLLLNSCPKPSTN